MTLLVAGIVLWWAAHFFKRFAPEARAQLGDRGKGLVAFALLVSVTLMVIGFRGIETVEVYVPPDWGRHVNNLMMLFAVILFGTGSSQSSLRKVLRHPMLMGMLLWALAHLLVNGDLASVILFGSMAVWAVAEIVVINRSDRDYTPWEGGSIVGTLKLLTISTIAYAAIGAIHTWLGYWPFP